MVPICEISGLGPWTICEGGPMAHTQPPYYWGTLKKKKKIDHIGSEHTLNACTDKDFMMVIMMMMIMAMR